MKADLSVTNVERDYSNSERLVLELDLKGGREAGLVFEDAY